MLREMLHETTSCVILGGMGRPPKDIRTRRDTRSGRYLICYIEAPDKWHQTPEDEQTSAIQWARRNRAALLSAQTSSVTLDSLVRGIFLSGSDWRKRMESKGHSYTEAYMQVRDGHLRNYILPLFGREDPRTLSRRYVDDALLAASRSGTYGKPLAPATMHKIVHTLNIILEELVDQGIIARNPCEGMAPYSKAPVKPRGAIPQKALAALFPPGHGQLVQVWGSGMWAACMCLLNDTGIRPGELRALKWREIDDHERFIAVRHGVQSKTEATIKGTKTGIVRAAFISVRTAQELAIWRAESRHNAPDDFVFTLSGAAPVSGMGVISAFRRGLKAAGYAGEPWTPYWLRHSFGTYHLADLDDSELLMLMGHTNIVTNATYRHPDDDIVRKRALPVRDKLDKARETR